MTSPTARANSARRAPADPPATTGAPCIAITTPSYDGKFCHGYVSALLATTALLGSHGIAAPWLTGYGDAMITKARNTLAATFLAYPAASHLLFVDADIEWQAADVLRLLAHDVDFVVGAYPRKSPGPPRFCLNTSAELRPNGLAEAALVPLGFALIKRGVFIEIIRAGAAPKIVGSDMDATAAKWLHDFFRVGVDEAGLYWGEDFAFSALWRSLGGRIWLDPAIKLKHHGAFAYEGDPATMFQSAPSEVAA
jgi:hypothetical protein